MQVSFYKNITQTTNGEIYPIEDIITNIKNGTYQDHFLEVRQCKTEKMRQMVKKTVPYFTVSGTFKKRSNDGLIEHSGLLAADFDDVPNINENFERLARDPYTFAIFKSISGEGICVIVKIKKDRHAESFEGLQEYYYKLYKLNIDLACRDVSRPRFVSWDQDAMMNTDSAQFTIYPKKESKEQTAARATNYLHTQSKFERVLGKINTDITGDYRTWIALGFAIASEYGIRGQDYFIHISQYSHEFDHNECVKQYQNCCRYIKESGARYTINTFYYYCKLNGVDISDQREDEVIKKAYFAHKAGKAPEEMLNDITEADRQVIDAVKSEQYKPSKDKDVNIDDVILWLDSAYSIKRNEITRAYELDGTELEQEQLNTIYLEGKKIFTKLSRELFETIIFSNHTPTYNPIRDYIDTITWDGTDTLQPLAESITSDTGTPEWRQRMLTKWLLGIMETIYDGEPNILLLILAGEKNTGKTQFFKRLLPEQLRRFFANSQLDKGKDDEVLMTQKLIIFDDEYSGKSKQDSKHMKRMLSSDTFTLREAYGRKNVTLKRIATLCGTCNETEILNDSTGNRRIIVIEATGRFNYQLYNTINKEQLFAQLRHLYQSGDRSTLSTDDINKLEQFTASKYSEISLEREMIFHLFEEPRFATEYDFRTASVIKDHIETYSKQKIGLRKLGMELKNLGYVRTKKSSIYGYLIIPKSEAKPLPQSFSQNGNFSDFSENAAPF